MLRVAFATSDGSVVDQHFGWCPRFDVYEVDAEGAKLSETRLLLPDTDNESDKIEGRLASVRDCAILNICEIGGAAAARVVGAGIHPMKWASGTPVRDIVVRLQAVLAGNPPPWLRKALLKHDPAMLATVAATRESSAGENGWIRWAGGEA
jgi:nitrogen fixation protein NifX